MVAIDITRDNIYSDTSEVSLTGDQNVPSDSLFVVRVTPDVSGTHTLTVPSESVHLIVNAHATNSFDVATTGAGSVTLAGNETATIAWDIGTSQHVIIQSSGALTSAQFVTPEEKGAANDNSTDDATAVQAAIDDAIANDKLVYLQAGSGYRVGTALTASSTVIITGAGTGKSKITTATTWTNNPVLDLQDDGNTLRDFAIEEASASATDSGKSGATNCGIQCNSANNVIENVTITGFGFGVVIRATAGDSSADGNTLRNVRCNLAYSWGFEVDSAQNTQLIGCHSYANGLDGFKIQNAYSRTTDGLIVDKCVAYDNGQRDTAAGGAESTNGNGLDLFAGGFRFKVSNSRFYANYGSGLVMKGSMPQPSIGEGTVVNTDFTGALSTSSGVSHGVEIGIVEGVCRYVGCNMSGNTGDGVRLQESYGNSFIACNVFQNERYGIGLESGFDNVVRDCNIQANKGLFGVGVGTANDASYVSRRVLIENTRISGNFSHDLNDNDDPRDAQTEVFTERGIQVYSDSADVTVSNCHLYNLRNYAINNYGQRTRVLNCHFFDLPTFGVYNQASSTFELSSSVFTNAAATMQYNSGTGTAPAIGTTMTGGTSGATGVVKSLVIDSGSFGTSDAAGNIYLYQVTGDFQAGESLSASGVTMTAASLETPFFCRGLGTRAVVKNNTMNLAAARAFIFAIYLDSTLTFAELEGNQIDSDFAQGVEAESGVAITSFGVTYTENTVAASGSQAGTYHVQQGSSRGMYSSSGVGNPILVIPFDQDGDWPIF